MLKIIFDSYEKKSESLFHIRKKEVKILIKVDFHLYHVHD